FKAVNDTYGHPIGDEVLRRLALTCLRCFPRKDDFVARYGGEEFAAILSIHDAENAARIAERFLDTVRALRVQYEGGELGITVSAGLALLRPGDDALGWVARADRALYAAKQGGRDRFVLADAPEPKARAAA
ncbi:MAG: GGDEF domain-containing protein, partial [Myxococcales bacterium]|nr:GGDEF domain-containing protein [Myxococcales bacterium]